MITLDYVELDKRTKEANEAIRLVLKLAPAIKDFPFGEGSIQWSKTWGVDITLKGELPSMEVFCSLAGEIENILNIDFHFYPPSEPGMYARYAGVINKTSIDINLWWMPKGAACFWIEDEVITVPASVSVKRKLVCK